MGYDATWLGAFVGFGWGAATGFVIGMATAFAINLTVSIHLARLLRRLGVAAAPDAPDA